MKNQTCCFTEHGNLPAIQVFLKSKLKKEIEGLIKNGVIYYGSGGAIGFDTLAALTVLELRKKHPQIKLIMVLPCREQDEKWSERDKQVYAFILQNADKIVYTSEHYHSGCMHERNRYLVDYSGHCIVYLTESKGGTAYTVDYAKQKGLEIINIAQML